MPEIILPGTMVGLLVAFEPCFRAPSYQTFRWLVAGWIHCLGRRTITAVAVASGGVGRCHISGFHRFFTRATWSLDALGQVIFRPALPWIPADQPLFILVDDTLARKTGKGIGLATMHHDPLLSTARKPFSSFGHVWVVLALWVPLPMGGARGFALPVLFRVYVGAKRGGTRDAPGRPRRGTRQRAAEQAHAAHPRPTKLALARELVTLVAGWAGDRTIYAVVDSAYAARPLLEGRPSTVHVLSRLPAPKAMAATRRRWDPLPLTLYGRAVTPLVFGCTALWYGALRDQPVRIVVARDPSGRRRDEAFFCTDLTVDHAFILTGYARRWTIEVAFHDQKQFLGFEDPQNRSATAVARTAPLAGLVYDLVLLWYAAQGQQGRATAWLVRPWYRSKTAPSFLDMLTAVRQDSWRLHFSVPPSPTPVTQYPPTLAHQALPPSA
jgi:hypothetical protein